MLWRADMLNLKKPVPNSAMKQKNARPGPIMSSTGPAILKHLQIVHFMTKSGSGRPKVVKHPKVKALSSCGVRKFP